MLGVVTALCVLKPNLLKPVNPRQQPAIKIFQKHQIFETTCAPSAFEIQKIKDRHFFAS